MDIFGNNAGMAYINFTPASFFSIRALAGWRKVVQSAFALFCLYAGYRFFLFFLWATGQTEIQVSRPPSVEGFLPISALLSLKRLFLTGEYDMVHPAGLTIFMAALLIGFLLRKGFCGWICPVGFASNLADEASRRFKQLRRLPVWLEYPMLSLKYILLFLFLYLILWRMDLAQIEAFLKTPYNLVAEGKMLLFFLEPSRLAAIIMAALVLASFVLRNFWCRYLCPYGALLGLLALTGPLGIRRDAELCIDCKKCDRVCPGSISVSEKTQVRSNECIGCLECLAVCPKKQCLTLTAGPLRRPLPPALLPVATVTLFLLFWLIALITGHWHSMVPPEVLREYYGLLSNLGHPPY